MEYATLPTGAKMPLIGIGSWNSKDEELLSNAIRSALDNGYRLIDTAYLYDNEHIIGKVLKEYLDSGKIKREELFVTTKLPIHCHHPDDVAKVVPKQLEALQLEYIDLYLIHGPTGVKRVPGEFASVLVNGRTVDDGTDHIDTWRGLEKLHKAGTLKAIGVSNFNIEMMRDLYEKAEIKPMNLQVETHIYWPQYELHDFCKERNISFTAFAPIGSPGRVSAHPEHTWPEADILGDPLVVELSKKHHKTAAQILLRHLTQRGICVIPKSVRAERIAENFNIFDFKLTDEEVEKMNAIPHRVRLFLYEFGAGHRYFPFKDAEEIVNAKYGIKKH